MNWSALLVALVPASVVTLTATGPAGPAGETALTEVLERTSTLVAAVVPNMTALAPRSPVPVMMTVVPPAGRPATGLTAVTTGGASYVNWSATTSALVPPALVTVTSTWPVPAGEVTVRDVAELRTTLVPAVGPKSTTLALGKPVPEKPVPVMVTEVAPARGPAAGVMAVTVGAAT